MNASATKLLSLVTLPATVRVITEDRGTATRITVKGRDESDVRAAKKALASAGIAGRHLKIDGCAVWSKGHYAQANSGGAMRKLWDVYYAGVEV